MAKLQKISPRTTYIQPTGGMIKNGGREVWKKVLILTKYFSKRMALCKRGRHFCGLNEKACICISEINSRRIIMEMNQDVHFLSM